MQQVDVVQAHVQGFRSVHKNFPPSITSIPLDSPNVVHIDCYTDSDTNKDFVFWEEIEQAFDGALCVRNKTKILPYLRGKDYRVLEPHRIAAVSDTILDVVVGGELPISTDTANADMIAALQRTISELSLNTPLQSPTGSARRNPVYGDEMEAMQNYNHMDMPSVAAPLRGPQTTESHSQDNIDSNNNKSTVRLRGPQDHAAAANTSLMQTMIKANHGDIHAQVALGDRYKNGREVHQDYQVALEWYCKAAEQGHPRAQYSAGFLYKQGKGGIPQDHTKAFDLLMKSAVQGYADAQAKVSEAYTEGAGVPKDNIKAMEWKVKAAENGHAGMQFNMGAAYEKGHGVPQSDSMSFAWYIKSAVQGTMDAQVRVADAFQKGCGVPQDENMAFNWYTMAADRGVAEAQFAVGKAHMRGSQGLPQSTAKAVDWFLKAAAQGYTEAHTELERIQIYGSTLSYPPNIETRSKIREWLVDAADKGLASAQACMGRVYWEGLGVRRDESNSLRYFLDAANQGDAYAQSQLAFWYEKGIVVPKNRQIAFEWYVKLIVGGRPYFQKNVLKMLRDQ